jgi:hypothetical protein
MFVEFGISIVDIKLTPFMAELLSSMPITWWSCEHLDLKRPKNHLIKKSSIGYGDRYSHDT